MRLSLLWVGCFFILTSIVEGSIQKSVGVRKPLPFQAILSETPQETEEPSDPHVEEPPLEEAVFREPWGLFFNAAYTYWYAGQEGLTLGRTGQVINVGGTDEPPRFEALNKVLSQPFQYQSGFQVGVGWKKEGWSVAGKYTWISNTTSQNASALTGFVNPPFIGVWVMTPWFLQVAGDRVNSLVASEVFSQWHLSLQMADFLLGHAYDRSSRLILTPYGGLKAAWIGQKLQLSIVDVSGSIPAGVSPIIESTNGSNCYCIGPRFGVQSQVLLGLGFSVDGDVSGSVLWTEYTKIFHREDQKTDTITPFRKAVIHDESALRPVLETGLGASWGTDICDEQCHIHFSAHYDFLLFWNQNAMRAMMGNIWDGNPVNGDLYLHGLTLSAEIGF